MAISVERKFVCEDCGEGFWTTGAYAYRCPSCSKKHTRKMEAEKKERKNVSPYKKQQRHKRGKAKSVKEFMHDCIVYNRKHGTNLNYGTYDRLIRHKSGELTVEVKL